MALVAQINTKTSGHPRDHPAPRDAGLPFCLAFSCGLDGATDPVTQGQPLPSRCGHARLPQCCPEEGTGSFKCVGSTWS